MKWSQILLAAVLGCLLSLGAAHLIGGKESDGAKRETAFERIQRTGTIRCGYYVLPPIIYRDTNTGRLSGISIDIMESLVKKAGLKVDWTEEVTFGNWIPALEAGRYDAVCAPIWPDIAMLKTVTFTEPLFYAGLSPLVKKDDARFQNDLERLNAPDVTFLAQDGNAPSTLAREIFPKAKFFALMATADASEYYQNLLTNKVDVVLTDHATLSFFTKTNGDLFRFVAPDKPVKFQSYPLALLREDFYLKDFLDQGIREMNYNGEIDRILRKWEPEPGKTYLRVAPPAELQTK